MATLKQRLKNKERVLGTMLNIVDHPDMVKILKACGYDYFIIDCEHGYMEYAKIAAMIALAKEMGIAAMVRVPGPLRECVLRYMDMGADGLMLPNADSAELAAALVQHAKYAPMGNRGISMMRGHNRYEAVSDQPAYMRQANEETVLIAQIESPEGVANIEKIMAVDGIDVAFIGPNDLSQSLGIPGQFSNPLYVNSLEKVIATCQKAGKHCGTHAMNIETLQLWAGKGMDMNLYSNEVNMIMNQSKAIVGAFKG